MDDQTPVDVQADGDFSVEEHPVANPPVEELQSLVLYLATTLVGSDEGITVDAEQRGPTVQLHLHVPETELGRVIGKEGRIARAMRTLVTITSSRHNLHARLEIDA